MNQVTMSGYAAAKAEKVHLKGAQGEEQYFVKVTLAVKLTDKTTYFIPVSVNGWARERALQINTGDEVCISGKMFYKRTKNEAGVWTTDAGVYADYVMVIPKGGKPQTTDVPF